MLLLRFYWKIKYFAEDKENVCSKITELTDTERSRREYEECIRERQERLQLFVDSHIEDEKIRRYIKVNVKLLTSNLSLRSCFRKMR